MISALAEFALAAALLHFGRGALANRALAMFMVSGGVFGLVRSIRYLDDSASWQLPWFRAENYLTFADGILLIFVAAAFPRARIRVPQWLATPWPYLAGILAFDAFYAWNASWLYDDQSIPTNIDLEANGMYVLSAWGPLEVVNTAFDVSYAAVPVWLAWIASRATDPLKRRSALLLATGIALTFLWIDGLWLREGFAAENYQSAALAQIDGIIVAARLCLFGVFFFLVARTGFYFATGLRGVAGVCLGLMVAAIASSIALGPNIVVFGLWILGAPLLTAYALLRCQLFDIDLKIKWGVRGGTLAGVFLAVFFVVATVASEFLTGTYGYILGGVAAGLLLFALTPLQKFAERAAERAMPNTNDSTEYLAFRKLEVYKAAAEELAAGGITTKERRALQALRAKLGIAAIDAASVERDVLTGVA